MTQPKLEGGSSFPCHAAAGVCVVTVAVSNEIPTHPGHRPTRCRSTYRDTGLGRRSPPCDRRRRTSMGRLILEFASLLVFVLQIAIFLRAIMSWFPSSSGSPILRVLTEITDPILKPLRR